MLTACRSRRSFTKLPQEVRDQIYDYVLYCLERPEASLWIKLKWMNRASKQDIFRISRQMRHEAVGHYLRHFEITICGSASLRRALRWASVHTSLKPEQEVRRMTIWPDGCYLGKISDIVNLVKRCKNVHTLSLHCHTRGLVLSFKTDNQKSEMIHHLQNLRKLREFKSLTLRHSDHCEGKGLETGIFKRRLLKFEEV